MGISPISPWSIPLFNTVVLLSSGVTLTWAHNAFIGGRSAIIGIVLTLLLALCFVVAQYIEFKEATFSMSDGVFGSLFFFSTGFHGLHVIFGGLFLLHCTVRLSWSHFSPIHCLGFEFSVVYWHFVDVVWLFLYTFVYGWSY